MGGGRAESIIQNQESSFLQKVNLRKKLNSLSVINIRFLVLMFYDFCKTFAPWQVLSRDRRGLSGVLASQTMVQRAWTLWEQVKLSLSLVSF